MHGIDSVWLHHHAQSTDSSATSLNDPANCRTTAPHTARAKSRETVENRGENSRAGRHTTLPHKAATHDHSKRRKQRATGLWLRGTVWQFRVKVPADVAAVIGRECVWRSLRTSDYRVAIRQARKVASEVESEFEAIRRGEVVKSFDERLKPESLDRAASELVRCKVRIAAPAPVQDACDAAPPPLPPWAAPTAGLTVKQAYQRYIDDPGSVRSVKTLYAYRAAFERLIEILGETTPISTVTRDDCRRVLDTLRSLPPNSTKRFRGKSTEATSKIAKTAGITPMSATTINSYLNKLSALSNWAVNEGYIDKNPARGLRVLDPVRKKDKRHPFSNVQLRRIFNAPTYRRDQPKRAKFWVPLIGLFSGMRLNEICQLDTADVRLIDDTLCFVVTTEGQFGETTKRVKTRNAERIVPVHPKLIDIGFCGYLDGRRGSAGTKLFSDLSVASTGYFSDNFSKSFSYFLEKCGAKTARTSFHSFRHNFRDALREARVDRDIAYALGGWAGDGSTNSTMTAEQYGRGFSVAVLARAVAAISYRGLPLDHLAG